MNTRCKNEVQTCLSNTHQLIFIKILIESLQDLKKIKKSRNKICKFLELKINRIFILS